MCLYKCCNIVHESELLKCEQNRVAFMDYLTVTKKHKMRIKKTLNLDVLWLTFCELLQKEGDATIDTQIAFAVHLQLLKNMLTYHLAMPPKKQLKNICKNHQKSNRRY